MANLDPHRPAPPIDTLVQTSTYQDQHRGHELSAVVHLSRAGSGGPGAHGKAGACTASTAGPMTPRHAPESVTRPALVYGTASHNAAPRQVMTALQRPSGGTYP